MNDPKDRTITESSTGQIDAPFLILLERMVGSSMLQVQGITVLPALRTSGLLRSLAPEDLLILILILTFTTPQGRCEPTLSEIAEALGISKSKAGSRIERLTKYRVRE